ncbi:ankyrin repeat protein [Chryseobacterium defluvii]|uniref:Ankyrin repeat protein n=1 Tax=Chryseobacterium defluvii TaxID=160396 RepID=A0A840KEM0_9FLAO|nr:ankyrin repeat domain-containing protein [Chryseobacterium defluvii]MBB4805392.1 ankyrin repeat protein [Chryseobacterium defluvii]
MNEINEAIMKQDFTLAAALLKNGGQWDIQPFMAAQAYQRIIEANAFELLELFIEKEHISLDVFEYEKFEYTIFSMFSKAPATEELLEFMDKLLPQIENIDDELMGVTWLAYSVENRSALPFIQKLIDHGCDVSRISSRGENLLFYTQDIQIIRFLLDEGLNVNAQNAGGNTVMFEAIARKNTELVELYLQYGAELNIQNKNGETPYHKAFFTAMDTDLVELLFNHEPIRLDLKNKNGQTFFFEFADYSPLSWDTEIKLMQKLLEAGADIFQAERNAYYEEKTPAQIIALKSLAGLELVAGQDDFDANRQDNAGNSWLHYVCSENLNYEQHKAQEMYKKVKLLLERGASPGLVNDQDKTPVDMAQDDDLKSKTLSLLLKHLSTK